MLSPTTEAMANPDSVSTKGLVAASSRARLLERISTCRTALFIRAIIRSSSANAFTTLIPLEVSCTTLMISDSEVSSMRMTLRTRLRMNRTPRMATGPNTSASNDRVGC